MSVFKHILLSAFIFIWSNTYSQQESNSTEFTKASELYENGSYTEAFELLEQAIEGGDNSLPTLELMVNTSVKADKAKDVLKIIEDLIKTNPASGEYYFLRGVLFLQMQRYTKSDEDLNKAIAFNVPEEYLIRIYLNKGMLFLQLQEYDMAEEAFLEALSLDEKNPLVNHSLGMLQYKMQQYDEAIAYFIKSLKQESDNQFSNYNLAMSYLKIDDNENACFYFNKACDMGYKNACKMLYLECTK